MTSAYRNQTGPAPHTANNNNPFSHIDGRGQNHHYGGPQRSHHREKAVLLPELNRLIIIIIIFLLGDSSMHTLMKGTTGDTPLPCSLH